MIYINFVAIKADFNEIFEHAKFVIGTCVIKMHLIVAMSDCRIKNCSLDQICCLFPCWFVRKVSVFLANYKAP